MSSQESLILGLGISGLSVAKFLQQQNIPFSMLDSRAEPPKLEEFKQAFPNAPLYTNGFPPEVLRKAKTLILSPGLSKEDPAILPYLSPNVEIVGDIELFAKALPSEKAKVVAITGSNGKSTVTTLLGEMAKEAGIRVGVGGNLGTPALTLLENKPDLYILELSSFQLETTYSLKPTVSTLLNLCLDHMDRYNTLEEYFNAKARIFNHAKALVVNRDDPYILQRLPKALPTIPAIPAISFGLNLPPLEHFGVSFLEKTLLQGETPLMPFSALKLLGQHNIANALAALGLGYSIQLPMEAMLSALKNFKGLPHRGEWVRERNHVQWVNDSKGTNVGATLAALQGFKNSISGKWILIAGGVAKNADFTPLKESILDACRAVILIGEATTALKELLGSSIPCVEASNMEEAVFEASKKAEDGDGVLLSPACASFDMFTNFEHRGNVFKECVRNL